MSITTRHTVMTVGSCGCRVCITARLYYVYKRMDIITLLHHVPREVRSIIAGEQILLQVHLIRDEPFSREEIQWLMKTRRMMSVTFSTQTSCCVDTCMLDLSSRLSALPGDSIRISCPVTAAYSVDGTHQEVGESYWLNQETMEDLLAIGTGPWIREGPQVGYTISGPDDLDEEATMMLLDVRSVYRLLERRARVLQSSMHSAAQIARRATLKFLSDVCAHYTGREMLLKEYLCSSALQMELDIEVLPGDGPLTPQYEAQLRDICAEYRAAITHAVM